MNEKSLRVLEFNKIIDKLKTKASSSLGLKHIENLKPMIKSSNSGIDLEESRRWWDCGESAEMEWTSEGNQKRTLVLSMCDGAGAS